MHNGEWNLRWFRLVSILLGYYMVCYSLSWMKLHKSESNEYIMQILWFLLDFEIFWVYVNTRHMWSYKYEHRVTLAWLLNNVICFNAPSCTGRLLWILLKSLDAWYTILCIQAVWGGCVWLIGLIDNRSDCVELQVSGDEPIVIQIDDIIDKKYIPHGVVMSIWNQWGILHHFPNDQI